MSEQILRQAALACYRNAESLDRDANLLLDNDCAARATALAIIGLEEFAKAIVFTAAALLPEERQVLVERLSVLNSHRVKHLIASLAEAAQIASKDYLLVMEQDSGYSVSGDEYLAALFEELKHQGLAKLIGTVADANRVYKKQATESESSSEVRETKYLLETERKDAAFYVDLTADGVLHTTDRVVTYAASEILSLEWFFSQYGRLPNALEDDGNWRRFAALV